MRVCVQCAIVGRGVPTCAEVKACSHCAREGVEEMHVCISSTRKERDGERWGASCTRHAGATGVADAGVLAWPGAAHHRCD